MIGIIIAQIFGKEQRTEDVENLFCKKWNKKRKRLVKFVFVVVKGGG